MTNADLFKKVFGRYATEIWAMPENNYLEWLNAPFENNKVIESLQKLEPKKIILEKTKSWGTTYMQPICPNCDRYVLPTEFIGDGTKINYCDSCGQVLDWNDVDIGAL